MRSQDFTRRFRKELPSGVHFTVRMRCIPYKEQNTHFQIGTIERYCAVELTKNIDAFYMRLYSLVLTTAKFLLFY